MEMHSPTLLSLARADLPTSSDWKLVLVLMYLGILAVTGLMVFIPFRLAKGRRHRHVELLTAAAVLWGVISAGVFLYASTQQLNWSNEQATLIESGYYDPQDTSAAPKWPWIATAIIAGAYAALIAWSLAGASAPPASSAPGPRTPG
jgi:hypothetical protein